MRLLNAFFITLAILTFGCNREINQSINGYWEEIIQQEQPYRNVLFFEHKENGMLSGKLFMLQPSTELLHADLDILTLKQDSLYFNIPDLGLSFIGKYHPDSMLIEGTLVFPEGLTVPIIHRKTSEERFKELVAEYIIIQDTTPYTYTKPKETEDGWNISSLENEKINAEPIVTVVDSMRNSVHGMVDAFIIIRNGKLVLDEYFFGYTVDDLHYLSSNTKSVTSLLVGKALDMNKIKSINDYIFNYLPEFDSLKKDKSKEITIKNMLGMQIGFEPSFEEFNFDQNMVAFVLDRPMKYSPGEQFYYDNIAPNLFAAILKNATGMHADEFARQYLFEPMQIQYFDWDEAKQQGYPICQGSLQMRPRDLAKLGYLLLNNGQWKNNQIIDKSYIKDILTVQSVANEKDGVFYSYLWWIADFYPNDIKTRVIYAGGSGGQYMFVIPRHNAIVLFTGSNFGNLKEFELFDILESKILPAFL